MSLASLVVITFNLSCTKRYRRRASLQGKPSRLARQQFRCVALHECVKSVVRFLFSLFRGSSHRSRFLQHQRFSIVAAGPTLLLPRIMPRSALLHGRGSPEHSQSAASRHLLEAETELANWNRRTAGVTCSGAQDYGTVARTLAFPSIGREGGF